MHSSKAGRFVGWADCYAAIVLADNATFLLVVNSIVAFWQNSANLHMKSHATVAQPLEHLPCNYEVVGSSPILDRIFSNVCAHFGILRRCRIILSRFRLRGQLQYRSALRSAVKIRRIFEIQVQNIAMISSISSWKHTKAWRLTWKQWFEIIDIKN